MSVKLCSITLVELHISRIMLHSELHHFTDIISYDISGVHYVSEITLYYWNYVTSAEIWYA